MSGISSVSNLLSSIKNRYLHSAKRLLIIDYDGTLVPLYKTPADSIPDPKLLELLTKLTSDPKNEVVISSGRDKHTLSKWIKVPDITLIAEHGIWHKGKKDSEFIAAEGLEKNWIEDIKKITFKYNELIPASITEVKDHSISFHYRLSPEKSVTQNLPILIEEIKKAISNKSLEILEGRMIVEVKNKLVNKGTSAKILVEKLNPDFILAIGDDTTDEYIFKKLPDNSYTVKVGDSANTHAKYSLKDYAKVRELLNTLTQTSN